MKWPKRAPGRGSALVVAVLLGAVAPASAQDIPPATREAAIAAEQREKASALRPYAPNRIERFVNSFETSLASGPRGLHPFFASADNGGGLTVGAGWRAFVSPYNSIDLRGSLTVRGYKRLEAEFAAPRMFGPRGSMSVVGGWREATQVGFYGLGTATTSAADRTNYSFRQSYASALARFRPLKAPFVLGGGIELASWTRGSGGGSAPSIETAHTAETAPGLDASPTYVHTQASLGVDTRPAAAYARRGTYVAATFHDYTDLDDAFGFHSMEYEAIQHVPIATAAWALSFRAHVTTTDAAAGQEVPFFLMPAIGGGNSLRGFSSWRFRDRHTLLLSAEWRVLANRFLDMAVFYDAGKAVGSRRDLDLRKLKSDYGLGFRLHGPAATVLRVEAARSNEGLSLVFSSTAAF